MFTELKKLITATNENDKLFEVAVKIRKETSGLPEQVERAARGVLGDMSLLKRFQYVEELDRELKQHDKADVSWKVDEHRADGVRRPDAAALAGGQRGR